MLGHARTRPAEMRSCTSARTPTRQRASDSVSRAPLVLTRPPVQMTYRTEGARRRPEAKAPRGGSARAHGVHAPPSLCSSPILPLARLFLLFISRPTTHSRRRANFGG